jgi:hypothetical protein
MQNVKPLKSKEGKVPSENLIEKWLAEYGYDAETGTIEVHIKAGYFQFLIGLTQLTGESPEEAISRLLMESIRASIGDLNSQVREAIEEAYFKEGV